MTSLLMLFALFAYGSEEFAIAADTNSVPGATPSAAAANSAAVPAYRQANNVAILTINGVIDSVTLKSLERRIKKAVADGADAILLDIDTPGGEMFSTLEICSLLKSRTETPANIVAWVHPNAYSAGSIISLACREIVMSPGATMGDAAPIDLFGRQMAPTERAKFLSPLLTELIDSARRNHYDEQLVQAFVMLGQQLWMIESVDTGERVFVDRDEYRTVFGEDPPAQTKPTAPSAAALANVAGLRPLINQNIPRTSDNAALGPDELKNQMEFEQTLPPTRQPLTHEQMGKWKLVMQVTDGTTLLTVKPDEARYYGLATAIVASDADVKSYFGAQNVRRYDETWSEGLVRFLISWPVKAVLIAVFLICLFIELAMPGFGVFGTTAVIALLILVGAPALVGLAQWWDVLLILLGLLLVGLELFVIPGFGVVGVAGAICVLVGLVGTFVSGDITTVEGQNQMWTGVLATLLSVFISGIFIWFISRHLHSFPIVNRLILHTELKESAAAVGLLQSMGGAVREPQAGDVGVAETDLRPAGRAVFDGRLLDVKSASSYIDKGTPVRILSVGRFVIEVEEATS